MAASGHAQSAHTRQQAPLAVPAEGTALQRLLLVRMEEGRTSAVQVSIERALDRALAELGFIVRVSPLPFREAQLASGCSGGIRECGGQVAAALESEQLAVSWLEGADDAKNLSLRLFLFEAGGMREGVAQLPREPVEELELTVRALAESIFADDRLRKTAAASSPASVARAVEQAPVQAQPLAEPAPDLEGAQRRRALWAVGWPTLTVGAALLVAGGVSSAASHAAADDYERAPKSSRDEVDAALAHSRSAEHKADVARALWGVGGGLAAAGAFVLLWERFGPRADRNLHNAQAVHRHRLRDVRVSAAPSPRGVFLSLGAEL